MRPGSVILDFSIDEGGAVETSRPTTLREPAFVAENVFHHCVPNITSAVPRTTSYAVTNAALPYLLAVGEHGLKEATRRRPSLLAGVNLHQGRLVHAQIASALGQQVEAAFADWE
jgi:alanine dehydrogenase